MCRIREKEMLKYRENEACACRPRSIKYKYKVIIGHRKYICMVQSGKAANIAGFSKNTANNLMLMTGDISTLF